MWAVTEICVDGVNQLLTTGSNGCSKFVEVLAPACKGGRTFTEKR